MKRDLIINIWSVLLLVVLLTACNSYLNEIDPTLPDSDEMITMSLNLSVEQFGKGSDEAKAKGATTRTVIEPSVDIKNLWVIQFSGIVDESIVVSAKYIKDMTESSSVTLIPSIEPNKIIYIANTFNADLGVKINMSLTDMKNLGWNIAINDDATMTDPSNKTTRYFILNGSSDIIVAESKNVITATLKRNVAKIIINIKNSFKGMTIKNLAIRNVSNKSYYFTNRTDLPLLFPAKTYTSDYESEDIGNSILNKTTSHTYYVPVNKRGVAEGNVVSESKPLFAPIGSTYARVTVSYNDGSFFRYTFYLGRNLTNDFNLEANKSYTYTFDFQSKGSVDSDYRIEDIGSVDYTNYTEYDDSNCYILNPIDEISRVYYIPIEHRINDFWTNYSSKFQEKKIFDFNDWDFELMWYDCDSHPITNSDVTKNITIEKVADSENKSQQALKITIPAKFKNWGNVAIAVKSVTDGSTKMEGILWSWHFWITDYNPNIRKYTPRFEASTYPVTSGAIHRYEDNPDKQKVWSKESIYTDKFIMDRNLGARGPKNNDGSGAGSLYYQFGRKDPFPGNGAVFMSNYGAREPILIPTPFGVYFYDVVNNPTTFYYVTNNNRNWSNESQKTTYLWNDKNVSLTPIDGENQKSIFDPSPLGWRLPVNLIWSDFNKTKAPWLDTKILYKNIAYYPASGHRVHNSGNLSDVFTGGYCWSASPASENTGRYMRFSNTTMLPEYDINRANGLPVRPIQE